MQVLQIHLLVSQEALGLVQMEVVRYLVFALAFLHLRSAVSPEVSVRLHPQKVFPRQVVEVQALEKVLSPMKPISIS